MENYKEYIRELDELLGEYNESPGADEFMYVLLKFFDGIIEKKRITCPIETDPDGKSCGLLYLQTKCGKDHLVFLTEQGEEKGLATVDLDLRSLVKYCVFHQDDCEGIVFNPHGKHKFFIPKKLLMLAFIAGYFIVMDEQDQSEETDESEEATGTEGFLQLISCP